MGSPQYLFSTIRCAHCSVQWCPVSPIRPRTFCILKMPLPKLSLIHSVLKQKAALMGSNQHPCLHHLELPCLERRLHNCLLYTSVFINLNLIVSIMDITLWLSFHVLKLCRGEIHGTFLWDEECGTGSLLTAGIALVLHVSNSAPEIWKMSVNKNNGVSKAWLTEII